MPSELPAQWALPLDILLCVFKELDYINLRRCLRINREIHAAISTGESFRRTLFKSRVISPGLPPIGTLRLHPILEESLLTILCYLGTPRMFSAELELHSPDDDLKADVISNELITQPPLCVLGIVDGSLSDGSYTEARNSTGVTVGDVIQALCKQIQDEENAQLHVNRGYFGWWIYRKSDKIRGRKMAIRNQEVLKAEIGICSDPHSYERLFCDDSILADLMTDRAV